MLWNLQVNKGSKFTSSSYFGRATLKLFSKVLGSLINLATSEWGLHRACFRHGSSFETSTLMGAPERKAASFCTSLRAVSQVTFPHRAWFDIHWCPICKKFTDKCNCLDTLKSNRFIFAAQNFPFSVPDGSEYKEDNSELENLTLPQTSTC